MSKKAPPLPQKVNEILEEFFTHWSTLKSSRAGLVSAYQAIAATLEDGGILYLCGNGGSFADAMHIKGELAKSFLLPRPIRNEKVKMSLQKSEMGKKMLENLERALPVLVLGESHALRSAFSNDRDPVFCYAQELGAFVERTKNGILLAISTSGNAENILAAVTLARAYEITSISFTGPTGGKLAQMADIDWRTPSGRNAPEVQEEQLPLYHTLCRMIEAHFFAESES